MSDPIWTFEARITSPRGVVIRAEIAIPEQLAGPDTPEVLEVAQMHAARMLGMVKSIASSPKQHLLTCGAHVPGTSSNRCLRPTGHPGIHSDEFEDVPF